MFSRKSIFPISITLFAICWLYAYDCAAQESLRQLQSTLHDKAAFTEADLTAVRRGETVVKLLSRHDKREVSVCGLVSLRVPAESFLTSFRESLSRKSNPAILEIGKFSSVPASDDLRELTIEERDIEDLRQCVITNCQLKLSAAMIERLQNEMNWDAPDYRVRATQLIKQMLLDYVRDYLERGDEALIQYHDKSKEIDLADEQSDLMAASSYDRLAGASHERKESSKSDFELVESVITWSKMKFGLKPVIAINHITIYKRTKQLGTQILILSKQIYANHYFDSSLALTAFMSFPGANSESYLFYENLSRVDGLSGPFGGIKRDLVEAKAVDRLKSILQQSQLSLEARRLDPNDALSSTGQRNVKRWKIGLLHVVVLLICIAGLVALLDLRAYAWNTRIAKGDTKT